MFSVTATLPLKKACCSSLLDTENVCRPIREPGKGVKAISQFASSRTIPANFCDFLKLIDTLNKLYKVRGKMRDVRFSLQASKHRPSSQPF
jgi:hypothetical protein